MAGSQTQTAEEPVINAAIRSHHTATDGGAWDSGANVKRLANEDGKAVYRQMFAWVDPDADEDKKNAYKFPHHFVSGDGTVGAASVKACQAGIAVLNGGRGGADIPDEDRKGVWNHLAAHLRDAELEPAELTANAAHLVTLAATLAEPCWRAEFDGREYLVAPVVALVPGVLNGFLNPPDEVSKYVDAWNDAPVPIGHPTRRGVHVSARSLDVLEHDVVGRFQNVVYEENRLKGELWLDFEKAQRLGEEAVAVVTALEAGEPVEVSTAYFADVELTAGEWNGQPYEGINRNIRPDHLALLPGAKGACSWQDGCGAPRVHNVQTLERSNVGTFDEAILSTGGDMRTVTINVELTLDEQMERVVDALFSRQGPYPEPWGVRAVFPDRVIVDMSKGLMEFPYTVATDTGEIEFGEGAEVEVIYQRKGEGSGSATTNAQHTGKTGGCPCMEEHQETVTNGVSVANAQEPQDEGVQAPAPEPQAPSLPTDLVEFQRLVADLGGIQAVRDMLAGLKANADDERTRLVSDLTTNERCAFSADELRALPTTMLEKLERSLRPADYSGRGGPRNHNESDEWAVLAAPEVK